MKLKQLFVAAAIAALPAITFAANDTAANLVKKVTKGQVTIVKQFPSVGNLEGFVVQPKTGPGGQSALLYADKGGQYMVAGSVIDSSGQNLSQTDYQKYIADPMNPKIFAAAGKTNYFQQGKASAPHQAYVLVEPNCIACHMLYKELMPLIDQGKLSVRWIMVAFLKPDSMGKAAAILQASDPATAYAQDEANFVDATEEGSIAPAKTISPDTRNKLQANLAFMQKFGFMGTPVMIYKDSNGQAQVVRGFLPGKALTDAVGKMGTW